MSDTERNSKSSKTSATLFVIAGVIFILVSILGDDAIVFLPIGLAFIVIGIIFLQLGRSAKSDERDTPLE